MTGSVEDAVLVLLWTGLIMTVGGLLLGLVEWWMCRSVDQPARLELPVDEGTDLHDADDFFHPRGDASTALAAARIGHARGLAPVEIESEETRYARS